MTEPIKWDFPSKLYCRECYIFTLKGYIFPGKHICYCEKCYENENDKKTKEKLVKFENKEVIIDSSLIRNVFENGMCLQSNPCQHTCYIEIKNFTSDKEAVEYYKKIDDGTIDFKFNYSTQISCKSNGIEICRLKLISGKIDKYHFEEYLKKVPKILPGEEYYISPGIKVKVNENYKDPRKI